jgi:hypothetical protein
MTLYKIVSLKNNNWGSCESSHGEKFPIRIGDIFIKCDSEHNGHPQYRHLKSNKIFCAYENSSISRFEKL